ncbi:MAG: hypothetical protein C207_01191 [Bradyrhizobium sp. DFCI-1]|jgi:hypothetical protein|nr:MAG: hypothetical protein C207_01191 [Bradyrhizobium sp. DFCI-1]
MHRPLAHRSITFHANQPHSRYRQRRSPVCSTGIADNRHRRPHHPRQPRSPACSNHMLRPPTRRADDHSARIRHASSWLDRPGRQRRRRLAYPGPLPTPCSVPPAQTYPASSGGSQDRQNSKRPRRRPARGHRRNRRAQHSRVRFPPTRLCCRIRKSPLSCRSRSVSGGKRRSSSVRAARSRKVGTSAFARATISE